MNGWTQPGGFLILANDDYTGTDDKEYEFGFKVSSMVIVDSNDDAEKDGYFRKSGGFGDVELLGDLAPIEIGNYVWEDFNGDGIQDANETSIADITVKLYEGETCSGTQVGEATTDSDGHYYFGGPNNVNMLNDNSLEFNTTYSICVALNDDNLGNRILTLNDANNNENDPSEHQLMGLYDT